MIWRARFVSWLDAHSRQIAVVGIVLGFVVSASYGVVLSDQLRYLDERVYVQLTQSMAEGRGYADERGALTAYRPPGYPVMLLPFHLVSGGSVVVMRMLGVLCLAGSAWLLYLLARRAHSAAAGAIVAVAVSLYPLLIYTATSLYPQVPALFLLLLFLEMSFRATSASVQAQPRRQAATAVIAGLAAGMLIITVPTFGVSVGVVVGVLGWYFRRSENRHLRHRALALILLAAAVIPAAWCVRNAVVLHAFVPVSTNSGVNLLFGNSEKVSAATGPAGDVSEYAQRAVALGLDSDEVALDRFYRQAALNWITTHPGAAAELYVEKVLYNFWFTNDLATADAGGTIKNAVSALTYYPILGMVLLRILVLRRWPLHPVEWTVLLLVAVNVAVLAIFFTRLRLRMPLDGLTILVASTTLMYMLGSRPLYSPGTQPRQLDAPSSQ